MEAVASWHLLTKQMLHARLLRTRPGFNANLLMRTHETADSLAQRCGVHRQTVAEHTGILEAALMGTRHTQGEFDAAFARIDTLLREAGIVADDGEKPAVDATVEAA